MDKNEENKKKSNLGTIVFTLLVLLIIGLIIFLILKCSNEENNNNSNEAKINETKVDKIYDSLVKIAEYELIDSYSKIEAENSLDIEKIYCLDFDAENNALRYIALNKSNDIAISINLSSNNYTTIDNLLNSLISDENTKTLVSNYTILTSFYCENIFKNNDQLMQKIENDFEYTIYQNISYKSNNPDISFLSFSFKQNNGAIYSLIDYEYQSSTTIINIEKEPSIYAQDDSLFYSLLNKIICS